MGPQIASASLIRGITESLSFSQDCPYSRMLDEITATGYAATQLGPFGFLPTDPAALPEELAQRDPNLCSAFVVFPLGKAWRTIRGSCRASEWLA